mgnify:CR=1 FL=1
MHRWASLCGRRWIAGLAWSLGETVRAANAKSVMEFCFPDPEDVASPSESFTFTLTQDGKTTDAILFDATADDVLVELKKAAIVPAAALRCFAIVHLSHFLDFDYGPPPAAPVGAHPPARPGAGPPIGAARQSCGGGWAPTPRPCILALPPDMPRMVLDQHRQSPTLHDLCPRMTRMRTNPKSLILTMNPPHARACVAFQRAKMTAQGGAQG